MKPRILIIGLNKCATTSLAFLLRKSNIATMHYRDRAAGRILPRVLASNFSLGRPLLSGLDDYTAFCDMAMTTPRLAFEGCRLFRQFDATYPDAYFILNTRPVDDWIRSRLRHRQGKFAQQYAAALHCAPEDLPQIWREQVQAHTAEVREHFHGQTDRFLEFDIANDSPERLAQLLASEYRVDTRYWRRLNATERPMENGNAAHSSCGMVRAGVENG
ncbi:MAG: sulfotransferase [Pseudomonadota bacterium]